MAVTKISRSAGQTEALGEKLAQHLNECKVIALYGDLGMGKTAFVRGLARGFGISDGVSSPTFALVNEYHGKFALYHFDMYRITGWEDLYSTGFFDYLDSGGVLAIEWSENIEAALPADALRVYFKRGREENERILTFEGIDIL